MLSALVLLAVSAAVGYAAPPIWSQSTCGQSKYSDAGDMLLPSGQIVGGKDAREYEFPWQVSLRRKATNSHFCGGSIINERWVLTAAHCTDGQVAANVSIVVGEWQRSAESSVRQTLDVEKIIQNSGYNSRTMENDVSVIKVASDIVFNENVGPVCAPDPDNLYTYYKSQVSGWGTLVSGGSCCPDILQYVTVNVTTNDYCNSKYGIIRDRIYPDMICATDNSGSNERDACQGDSGGPLTIKEADGTFRIVGVVSWGIGCASGYPGVYARAGYFTQWISDNISE